MNFCSKILSVLLLFCAAGASAVESVPGVRGRAVKINGKYACLYDAKLKRFDFKKGMTVSFWVKGSRWSQEAGIIAGLGDTKISKRQDHPGTGFFFNSRIGGKRGAVLWAPKCFYAPLDKWVNVAFTYDTRTRLATAYDNGKPSTVWNVGKEYAGRKNYELSGVTRKGLEFAIGKCDGNPFEGAIDEVFIYNRALTPEEMLQVREGKMLPGLQAAYLFDDAADPGKDSSPVKRHLIRQDGPGAAKVPNIGRRVKSPIIAADKNLTVWSRHAIEKTFQHDTIVSTGKTTDPAAELAKNEYESFQLILSPSKALKNVKVSVTPFTLKGAVLATTLNQVGYVKVLKNSGLSVHKPGGVYGEAATMFEQTINHGPGEYPDPLPSVKPVASAVPGRSYAFWVTVKSSAKSPAGIYTTQALITADGGYRMTVPLKVKVRNFTLPEIFNSRNTAIMGYRVSAGNRENFHKVAAEHHVTLCDLAKSPVVTFDAKGNMKVDTAEFDKEAVMAVSKYGANTIYFPGWNFYTLPRDYNIRQTWCKIPVSTTPGKLTEEFKVKFGRYLEYMTAHLKKKGWLKYTRISMVDEPHTLKDYELCQEFAKLVRRHAPGVKTLVTKWPLKPLIGAPDIWCLGMIIPADIKAAVARGESFEWYPNWHFIIDRPLMDSRMLGFMMHKLNIKGILYFNITHHWENHNRLGISPVYTYPNGRIINGLGQIIYPPEVQKGKPVSSLRFVMCRDAYEDYEYLLIAEELIKKCKDPARAAAARKVIKDACDAIVPAYHAAPDGSRWEKTKWETDGSKLLKQRKAVADLIERLAK